MAHPPAPALELREGDEEELRRLVRASSVRAGLAQRARIVLLDSQGIGNTQIAQVSAGAPALRPADAGTVGDTGPFAGREVSTLVQLTERPAITRPLSRWP